MSILDKTKTKIERVRELAETLQNWNEIIKEKRFYAIYGRKFGFEDVKVQNTKDGNRIVNALIDVQEAEEKKEIIFQNYWKERTETLQIIEKFAKAEDIGILYRYLIGAELSEIPLTERQKHPRKVIDGAINRLQKVLNAEETIERQSQGVQNLLKGGKKKCKCCKMGFVYYTKEETDKFIFECDNCKKKYKIIKA
jgi:hypothetical protein